MVKLRTGLDARMVYKRNKSTEIEWQMLIYDWDYFLQDLRWSIYCWESYFRTMLPDISRNQKPRFGALHREQYEHLQAVRENLEHDEITIIMMINELDFL